MGRFSPTVRPIAAPGFLEALAGGFTTGLDTYDRTRDTTRRRRFEDEDRATAAEDRAEAARRRRDEDALRGIVDAPPPRQGGIVGPPAPGDDNEFGAALEQSGASAMAPAGPQSSSGVPGGFDAFSGQFERQMPRLRPRALPSGRMYDPQIALDEELAAELQKAEAAELARGPAVARRRRGLTALQGDDQYDITPQQVVAGSESDDLYEHFVENYSGALPRRGSQEWYAMLEAEAAARGRGNAPFRSGGSGGTAAINAQVSAAERELARAIRELEELEGAAPTRGDDAYGGLATMISGTDEQGNPTQVPLDEAASNRFVSDSTAHAGRTRAAQSARSAAQGRLDAVRRARGDNAPIERGGGRPILSPAVEAQMNDETTALRTRTSALRERARRKPEFVQNPQLLADYLARVDAAEKAQLEAIAARYRE